MKADETKNQELSKRLQRQVRDLEEELTDVRRKESEAIQRKNDLVGCNFLCFHYVFLVFADKTYWQWLGIFVFIWNALNVSKIGHINYISRVCSS